MKAKILAAIFPITLITSQSYAFTSQYATGQSCQSPNNDTSIQLSSDGAWNNSASATKNVWCPLVHATNVLQLTGASFLRYNASSSVVGVGCAIYIRDDVGSYYISATAGNALGAGGYGVDNLGASQMPNGGASINTAVTYAAYCSIPNNSPGASFVRAVDVGQLNP